MKNQLKPMILAGLSLFMFSCNSDDNAPEAPPVIEKTYHLSKIEQNYYENEENEGTIDNYLLHVIYNFDYDTNFKLNKVLYEDVGYKNDTIIQKQSLELHHTLDNQERLQSFQIKKGTNVVELYEYVYENDLLQSTIYNSITQGGALTMNFSYNKDKQMITSQAVQTNLLIGYSYNKQNQMDQFKINGQEVKLTYDDKLSPFHNLPYDLTSLLTNFKHIFPYTYNFATNITSFSGGGEVADVELTYNEANLPIRAIYYDGKKGASEIAFDITYSYEIKETVIKP